MFEWVHNHWCTGARWCEKTIWDLEKRVSELEGGTMKETPGIPNLIPRGAEVEHVEKGWAGVVRGHWPSGNVNFPYLVCFPKRAQDGVHDYILDARASEIRPA